jgi:nicotinamide-nucleotide amidase
VVRDELPEISAAVKESLARAPDLLVITGGLGATYDDMTLEGLAMALGRKVLLDQKAVEMIKKSHARRKLDYEMTPARLKMATIPEGSTPLQNPVGSAPAVFIDSGAKIFSLPGVPSEMKAIFRKHVLPIVKKGVGEFVVKELKYNVRGVTEGMLAPMLIKIVGSHPRQALYLKTHPRGWFRKKTPQIMVQMVSRGASEREVQKRLDSVARAIEKEIAKLGGRIC